MLDATTIFVCQNRRSPGHREGCCEARGAAALLAAFSAAVEEAGLTAQVKVRPSGCLDACPHGPVAWVVPGDHARPPGALARLFNRGTWYGGLVPRDAQVIVAEHLVGGTPVARCRF